MIKSSSLDRFITGNYGEDQFKRERYARELYGCNNCGLYPIEKVVNLDEDELTVKPKCPKCGGDTHFEKVREIGG